MRMRCKHFFCLAGLAAWLATGHPSLANDTLQIGNVSVPRGELVQGMIEVPHSGDGESASIPVTVFNGASDGPVLALIAGIHGAEYSPILAMQSVVKQLDPAEMSGAVIVVHNANLPAFRGRTIYFGPDDLKNLNRAFPGSADGTVTERIAHAITEHIIRQSDYLIDIHSGDANERLGPSYTAYYAEAGSAELRARSRRMTVAFGLDTIVLFGGDVSTTESQIYTSAQAVALGVPAMDVESGELGIIADEYIDPIVDGVMSVIRDLDIAPGEAAPAASPHFIADRARIYSELDGVWHLAPGVRAGQYVKEGTLLGTITDYHGNHLSDIMAPASGILLIVFGTPPVNKGDNIVVIGLVSER